MENSDKRYRFVKRDESGNVVITTRYDCAEEFADQILRDLRRFDLIAIKLGCSWEKVET